MRVADLYQRDIWYAKAILPILTDRRCETITPVRGKKACCLINGDRLLLVKKAKQRGKNQFHWLFAFQQEDRKFLVQESQYGKCICLFLICENRTTEVRDTPVVCAVKWNEARNLLNPTAGWEQQNIYVKKKNGAYVLTGPLDTSNTPQLHRGIKKGRAELLNYFYATSSK